MKFINKINLKEKFILSSIVVILPVLIFITFLTVKIVDKHNINNVKETLVKNSYLTHMFLYQNLNEIEDINPRNIYYLNLELSRVLNMRTQIYYQKSSIFFDSSEADYSNSKFEFEDDFKESRDLELALQENKNYKIKNINNNRFFLLTLPYYKEEETLGAVRLIYPLTREDLLKNNLLYIMSFINILAFIIIIIFIGVLTKKIVNPLKILGERMDEFSKKGELKSEIKISSGDEVEELSKRFQKMSQSITVLIDDLKNEKNKQKTFFDNMTHEIRTPLTTIIGYANILKKIDDPKKSNQALNYIESEGKRLLRLVNEIIASSKFNSGKKSQLQKRNTNLKQLVKESVKIMQYKAEKYDIKINYHFDSEVKVLIDRDKIKEVLLNIIDNAVVHSNSKKIDIILENNISKIVLKIIDYGSGINFDYEKLLDKQMKKNQFLAGHGLGLNISKEIMELHGGKLIIDSSVEIGTTITLIFALTEDDRK